MSDCSELPVLKETNISLSVMSITGLPTMGDAAIESGWGFCNDGILFDDEEKWLTSEFISAESRCIFAFAGLLETRVLLGNRLYCPLEPHKVSRFQVPLGVSRLLRKPVGESRGRWLHCSGHIAILSLPHGRLIHVCRQLAGEPVIFLLWRHVS